MSYTKRYLEEVMASKAANESLNDWLTYEAMLAEREQKEKRHEQEKKEDVPPGH